MSDEQRVTDEELAEYAVGAMWVQPEALSFKAKVILDLRDERTAHRAIEAKLRAATAEVEWLKKSRDSYKDDCARWKREAESNGRMEIEERALKEAAESALSATKAKLEALPKVCDGLEQDAFEQWAISEGFDMSQHPLHWLFLHPKTSGARQGWKAAIEYCLAALTTQSEGGRSPTEGLSEPQASEEETTDAK